MSNISTIHSATVYDAKKSKALTDQRLVVTIAKADKQGNYGPHLQQTMCTSIPVLTPDAVIDALNNDELKVRLLPHIVEFLQGQQNALIGARIKSGNRDVTTEQLEITGILDYLESETVAEKWDAQRVATWFTSVMAEPVGIALLDKGLSEDALEPTLKKWEKLFADSFGSKSAIPFKLAQQLDKALKLAPEGNPIVARFQGRIDKVLMATIENDLGL